MVPKWPSPPHPMIAIQSPGCSLHLLTAWYAAKQVSRQMMEYGSEAETSFHPLTCYSSTE